MKKKQKRIAERRQRKESNKTHPPPPVDAANQPSPSNEEGSSQASFDDDGANSHDQLFTELYETSLRSLLDPPSLERLRRCTRAENRKGEPEDIEYWLKAYSENSLSASCKFHFNTENQRFSLQFHREYLRGIELSEQLAFILGFPETTIRQQNVANLNTTILPFESVEARFMPDLSGGVSTLFVYAPGLIEPTLIGDCCSPLLRIAIVRGQFDEVVEDSYVAIQYHRLLAKEISEIQIQICSASGDPMPFQYGNCILTLHFKKMPYF